jgi:hydrogenase small subunit
MTSSTVVDGSAPALERRLAQWSVSRREFLKFCGLMAGTLALPARYAGRIAYALETAVRPPVVWLNFQDCTADTESFLRASQPDVDDLLLDILSVNYHETIMVPAGHMSVKSLEDTVRDFAGQYVCVVEGSIPTGDGGVYCGIGGRTALSIAQEVCSQALATLAVGTCAWEGGLAAAVPNPTGAVGVKDAVPGLATLINLPGCPVNVANLTATFVHFLTFQQWPETDESGRPHFAYGEEIHDECPRHEHYEHEEFVREWGDLAHRQGWCLFQMGCRGPEAHHNCPSVKWNDGTEWPIGAGHGCLGCSEQRFWDRHSPFYVPGDD